MSEESTCPQLEELMLALDDALPPSQRTSVSEHVAVCAPCQTRLSELDAFQHLSLAAEVEEVGFLEEPPHCDEVEDPAEREQRHARFFDALTRHDRAHRRSVAWSRGWIPIAALVPILVWVFSTHQSSVITADELLGRIDAVDQGDPARDQEPVHVSFVQGSGGPTVSAVFVSREDWRPIGSDAVPSSIANAVLRSGFEWRDLLHAQHVKTWRAAFPDRRDVVTDMRDQGLLVLRTSATFGEPRMIELAVRREKFEVVRELLVFGDGSQLTVELVAAGSPKTSLMSRTALPASTFPHPRREELESAELRARLVLGESGLDMRGQIHVSVDKASVIVSGVVSATTSERRRARVRLAEVPHVRVDLRDGPDRDLTPSSGLSRWLNRTFADQSVRSRFVPELTGSIRDIRRHLDVLAGLGERYPTDESLPANGVTTLRQLVDLHYSGLHTDLATLVEHVAVLSGTVPPSAEARTPLDWRWRVKSARAEAADLDRVVALLLTHNDVSLPEGPEVASSLRRLWTTLQSAQASGTR